MSFPRPTTGLIVRNTGSWYQVLTREGETVDCKVKGNFRLRGIRSTNPVAVGDHVELSLAGDGTGLITEIRDRKNYVIRKASNLSKQSHILAANVDLSLLLVTVSRPETSTTFVDRFLASAEAYAIPVVLLFNKVDELTAEEAEKLALLTTLYSGIGYRCLRTFGQHGQNLSFSFFAHGVARVFGQSRQRHAGGFRELLLGVVHPLSLEPGKCFFPRRRLGANQAAARANRRKHPVDFV